MASLRPASFALPLCSLFAACAGLAPDPDEVSIESLPVVELSSAERDAVDESEQEAIEACGQRRFEQAERAALAALDADPRRARARAVLGLTMLWRASESDPIEWRGLRAGERELRLAQLLAPDDAYVGRLHAVFLFEAGHVSAAAEAAEQALQCAADASDEERADLLRLAGDYRYELGEERLAQPHFEGLLALHPDDAQSQYRYGVCRLEIARVLIGPPATAGKQACSHAEAAALAFGRCWALTPSNLDAALGVAAARLRAAELADDFGDAERAARNRDDATSHLREVARAFSGRPEPHFHLALVAAAAGERDSAIASYQAALERDPEHVPSLVNLAGLRAEQDPVLARALFERLLVAAERRGGLAREELRAIAEWMAQNADG